MSEPMKNYESQHQKVDNKFTELLAKKTDQKNFVMQAGWQWSLPTI